jgi:tetratricopeptide (TPR) repeat protein
MRTYLKILFSAFILFSTLFVFAESVDEVYKDAIRSYEAGEFEDALQKFLNLEFQGIIHPDLFYNIGNCNFRLNNIGKSVLYYKKALKADPKHPEAVRNLKYALSFTKDKQAKETNDAVSTLWNKFRKNLYLNTTALIMLIIGLFIVVLINAAILKFRGREKTALNFAVSVGIILFLFFGLIGYLNLREYKNTTEAVLTQKTAIAFSGPGSEFTRQFTIHEGMIFDIEKSENEWSLIKLSNGLGGWIKTELFEKIEFIEL